MGLRLRSLLNFKPILVAALVTAILSLMPGQVAGGGSGLGSLPGLDMPKKELVELGIFLFFDARLSGDGGISCADCHDPQKGWADGKALSQGYPGTLYFRNSPTILNAAYHQRFYWDGRMSGEDMPTLVRDHLTEAHFMQADGRLIVERLKQVPEYEAMFNKAFGGEPTFGRILTAVASFVTTIVSDPKSVPFDRYMAGQRNALSPLAAKGLELFKGKAGCIQCHDGSLLSDGKFHSLGVPENAKIFDEPLRHISFRRFFKTFGVGGYHALRRDVGLYAITKDVSDMGKFRTSSLRGLVNTPPYMHNGTFGSLEEVIEFYNRGGGDAPNKSPLLKPLGLSAEEEAALGEFLKSLSGEGLPVAPPKLPDYKLRPLGKN